MQRLIITEQLGAERQNENAKGYQSSVRLYKYAPKIIILLYHWVFLLLVA